MNRFALSLAAFTFAASAFAQTSVQVQVQTPAPSAAESEQGKAAEVTVIAADSDKVVARKCLRETGSHIPRKGDQCVNANGSAYSREDLQRTGAADIGDALRLLDPSIGR
jgi:hypothetical protein